MTVLERIRRRSRAVAWAMLPLLAIAWLEGAAACVAMPFDHLAPGSASGHADHEPAAAADSHGHADHEAAAAVHAHRHADHEPAAAAHLRGHGGHEPANAVHSHGHADHASPEAAQPEPATVQRGLAALEAHADCPYCPPTPDPDGVDSHAACGASAGDALALAASPGSPWGGKPLLLPSSWISPILSARPPRPSPLRGTDAPPPPSRSLSVRNCVLLL